jgi:hypothetical protein
VLPRAASARFIGYNSATMSRVSAREPTAPSPPRERRGRSFKIVALVGLGLLALAAIVAIVAYYKFLHYERVAARHVPPNAAWAVRVDVERVALFEPVRRHLLPLVDRVGSASAPSSGAALAGGFSTALRQQLGLNLGMDLREIVVAGGPGLGDWLVVLGGIFPRRSDLIVRAGELLLSQAGVRTRLGPESLLLFEGAGSALAQAEDGTLILGSSPALVQQALPPSQRYGELGLSLDQGVGGFGLLPGVMLSPVVRRLLGSVATTVASIQRVHGSLEPEANGRVGLRMELMSSQPAAALAAEVQGWVGSVASLMAFVPGADVAGERALLSRLQVAVTPQNTVGVTSYLENPEVDRACQSLSAWLAPKIGAR